MKTVPSRGLVRAAALLALTSTAALAQVTTLADFDGGAAGGLPGGNLVQAPDGNFYGQDIVGGANGSGAIFRLTPAGSLTAFLASPAGANAPPLSIGGDGYLYGMFGSGGKNGYGYVFRISPSGTLTDIYDFQDGADGSYPSGTLVQGSDGNFYGEASQGGNLSLCPTFLGTTNGCGTLFRITPAPDLQFSVVYTFQAGSDGGYPTGGLVQGSDGSYYGLTSGTVFRWTPGGSVTTIGTFPTTNAIALPNGPLVEDASGNYWGTTAEGGALGQGVIFKASVANGFQLVWTFCSDTNCAGGGGPYAPLYAATDGNFYGSTFAGEDPAGCAGFGCGTIFRITPQGALTSIYSTTDAHTINGVLPASTVIQGSDGNLYSTAGHGGSGANSNECGGDNCGIAVVFPEKFVAPVVLTASAKTVAANSPFTLSYKVSQAITLTSQQCYAFVAAGGGNWSGLQSGSFSAATLAWTGSATVTPSAAGTYTYALTCGGQVSGFATVTVTPGSQGHLKSAAYSQSPSPAIIGQPVTLKFTLAGSGAAPTGTVHLAYGGKTLATLPLVAGVASFSPSTGSLPPGSYTLNAAYSGDANYAGVSANVVAKLVAGTETSLAAAPLSVTAGANCTLTATVKRTSGSGTPTGSVVFSVGAAKLATVALANGVAVFTAATAGVPAHTYPLVATYSGDANDEASQSAAVSVTVQ
jgi:uncharacterized repeat protein (TIGR03803 family)